MNLVDFTGMIANSITGLSDIDAVQSLSVYIVQGQPHPNHDLISSLSFYAVSGAAALNQNLVSNLSIYVIES